MSTTRRGGDCRTIKCATPYSPQRLRPTWAQRASTSNMSSCLPGAPGPAAPHMHVFPLILAAGSLPQSRKVSPAPTRASSTHVVLVCWRRPTPTALSVTVDAAHGIPWRQLPFRRAYASLGAAAANITGTTFICVACIGFQELGRAAHTPVGATSLRLTLLLQSIEVSLAAAGANITDVTVVCIGVPGPSNAAQTRVGATS